jgi:hypothetical protein
MALADASVRRPPQILSTLRRRGCPARERVIVAENVLA